MERDQATKFINDLLKLMVSRNGSDLFITGDFPPAIKVDGKVTKVSPQPLNAAHTLALARSIMNDKQVAEFEKTKEGNFAISPPGIGRFRVNAFIQQGKVGMVLRVIPQTLPTIDGLGVPQVLKEIVQSKRGLCIMVGATGSGKSTTLAAMVNYLNETEFGHILTVEDPIEFVYTEDKALINQREIGVDVKDFKIAMKHAVRQDPDIMLVGEMRDMETFETAMHAAETGHLVFGTIHASSAPSTIGRILDLFPRDMHPALRSNMGFNLKAVVAQKLLPTIRETPKRVPIVEIMIMNPTIKKLIHEERDEKLFDAIRIGKEEGMQLFNDSLYYFVTNEYISRATAFEVSPNVEQLKMQLKGIDVKQPGIL